MTTQQSASASRKNRPKERDLRRMVQLAEVFPEAKTVVTLSRQLVWSHFVALIPIGDALQRDFYAEMCRMERWNVRTLLQKIGRMRKPGRIGHV